MTIADVPGDVLVGGAPADSRVERLDSGAESLAEGGRRPAIILHERFLLAVAGALMTAGVVAIILGWIGAARSILVVKQIPYLISGGLLGVALATIGALTFFTHWLTVLVRDLRAQDAVRRREHEELLETIREERARDHEALVEAIRGLASEMNAQEKTDGRARSAGDRRPVRRAPRGS